MKILVLDDNATNCAAARVQLKEHELTVVSSYEDAKNLLNKGYDVFLTDLFMPAESSRIYGGRTDEYDENVLLPFGIFLAIEALNCGVKFVGVLSDMSHHANAMAELYSSISYSPFLGEGGLLKTTSGTKILLAKGVKGSIEGYVQPFPSTDLSIPYSWEEIEADRSKYDSAIFTKNWQKFLKDLLAYTGRQNDDTQ